MYYCVLFSGQARSETSFSLKVKGNDAVMPVSKGKCCPASDSPRKKFLFHTLLLITVVGNVTEHIKDLTSLQPSLPASGVFLVLCIPIVVIHYSETKN